MDSLRQHSTSTLLASDTFASDQKKPKPTRQKSLTIPYRELFSHQTPPPIEYLETELGITPSNMLVVQPLAYYAGKLKKRSIPTAIIFQLRNSLPSLRGRTIHYTTNSSIHSNTQFYNQELSQHLSTIQLNQRGWLNVYDVIPRPIFNEGYWIACLSTLNAGYAFLSIHLEGFFKTISAMLDQPLRNLFMGRLQETEIEKKDSRIKQFFKRLSITLFKTEENKPFKNCLKYGARAIYTATAGLMYLIGLPFSLAGNLLSYTQQFIDSCATLAMLPLRPITSTDKKDVAWVALKTIMKSLLCLIPTAISIGLLFTPAAPAIVGLVSMSNLAVGFTISSLLCTAYAFISLRASGFFNFHSQEIIRRLDKQQLVEQNSRQTTPEASVATLHLLEPSYSASPEPSHIAETLPNIIIANSNKLHATEGYNDDSDSDSRHLLSLNTHSHLNSKPILRLRSNSNPNARAHNKVDSDSDSNFHARSNSNVSSGSGSDSGSEPHSNSDSNFNPNSRSNSRSNDNSRSDYSSYSDSSSYSKSRSNSSSSSSSNSCLKALLRSRSNSCDSQCSTNSRSENESDETNDLLCIPSGIIEKKPYPRLLNFKPHTNIDDNLGRQTENDTGPASSNTSQL